MKKLSYYHTNTTYLIVQEIWSHAFPLKSWENKGASAIQNYSIIIT